MQVVKGLPTGKALNEVHFVTDFPPCTTWAEILLAEVLLFGMAVPPMHSLRRPVTAFETATLKMARQATFVLVEKKGDTLERSYGSIVEAKARRSR